MIANFVADTLFTDNGSGIDALIKQAAAKDRNVLIQWVIDFIRSVKSLFKGQYIPPEVLRLERKYVQMLKDVQGTERQKNTAENVGVRFSVAKSFDEQIDDVINGTHNPRLDLYVAETPEYLKNLNFSDSPILMRNSKVSEILSKHSDMSAEIIKQIPKAIENPLLVLKSKTHPKDSVVIITDILTEKGDMIIPVWANQTGNYIDLDLGDISLNTNFVASAYGRNTANLIEYAVNNDGVLYQSSDIEKVRQLLARNGLQLPTPLKLSDSDIIVPQSDTSVNTSISEKAEDSCRFTIDVLQ